MVCHVNTTSATTTAELNPLRAAFTGRPYRTKAPTSIHLPAHPRSSPRLANRIRCQSESDKSPASHESTSSRRDFLIRPAVLLSASFLLQHTMGAGAEESTKAPATTPTSAAPVTEGEKNKKKEDAAPATPADISSRIYDATAIGEPLAVGKDKGKVWDKLLAARIVYLGEAELVPDRDDRALELEIVRNLRNRCFEQKRPVSLALEIFPSDQQDKLNLFMQKKINGETLQSYNPHWPPQLWQEYEPLLNYCRDNGVRLVACGTPLEVLRIVQAEGIRGLPKSQRKQYAPPAGSGFISGFSGFSSRSTKDLLSSNQSVPFAPSSYLSIQARVVDDYSMSQMIFKAMSEGGSVGMLLVITGASHVMYGSRGVGIPARISKKLQKKNQAVILLDPERQHIRREGEAPVADFLWYSAAKTCSRNCFDRAEIARVMNAAGRRRDALPQDLQQGLDLGVVSPEILQNFFDLEKYPLISELIHRFQGFRERLLVDPKFLHRLAIEEAISITTTLLAQYERRKERFFEEIDYVLTDTIRGSVVDFFTVWLPAPTVSFISSEDIPVPENLEVLKGLIGSIPDNAFQKVITGGKDWTTNQRLASVIVGGLKLAGVGFISSIGAASASGVLFAVRRFVNPAASVGKQKKQTPLLKAATVYGCFLGTSANLRYQIIAGIVEHRLSDQLLTFNNGALLANALSFVVRTVNSYWGTQQWIDLARLTGLQPRKTVVSSDQVLNSTDSTALTLGPSQADASKNVDEINNQSGDNPT